MDGESQILFSSKWILTLVVQWVICRRLHAYDREKCDRKQSSLWSLVSWGEEVLGGIYFSSLHHKQLHVRFSFLWWRCAERWYTSATILFSKRRFRVRPDWHLVGFFRARVMANGHGAEKPFDPTMASSRTDWIAVCSHSWGGDPKSSTTLSCWLEFPKQWSLL